MAKYTNNFGIPLSLSVWLLDDGYDGYAEIDSNTFSVTEIIKPVRQIILGRRALAIPPDEVMIPDLVSLANARLGQAVHKAIEDAWTSDKLPDFLESLGIPKHVGEEILINPTNDEVKANPDAFRLYMEQRRTVKINDTYFLTGQYDFNFDGQLEDFKHTKTYAITAGVNDEYYRKQGSCYKFLFPDQITSDTTRISFILSDWMASRVGSKNYPASLLDSREYPLMDEFTTKQFIYEKFNLIHQHQNTPETQLPYCTDEDLWRDADVWKYYSNPANKARATKNFDNALEAQQHLASKGKGVIDHVKGKVKACKYCKAFPLCSQKDAYLISGELEV